jgi:hypothetical protein
MLRRIALLWIVGAVLAACSLAPGGVPQQVATVEPAGTNSESPNTGATGTPTPAAVDETGEPPASVEPPPATLTINGQSQESGIGTYCWNSGTEGNGPGMCADKIGVPTPRDPIQVEAAPFTAQFTFAPDIVPTGVSLTAIPVSPDDEMTVEGTPEWRWWPFGEGQTFELPAASVTQAELTLEPGLYALTAFTFFEGRGDVVYGFLVQVGGAAPTPAGVAFTLPATCQPREGLSPYVDPGGRYCLLFPSYFRVGDVSMDRAGFLGPALDNSIEPVFAALGVAVTGPAGERTLAQVVDEYVAANSGGLPTTRTPLTIGGEPAEMVEGLPGRTPHTQIFFVHAGTVYQFSVFPLGADYAQAAADIDAVWNAVRESFTFFQ